MSQSNHPSALPRHREPRALNNGFTFIELAVVLFLVALLLGALLGPVSLRLEAERRAETEEYLETVKQALIGFALRNGRLPCPDNNSIPDGGENGGLAGLCPGTEPPSGTTPPVRSCNTFDQWLPWSDIGVARADPNGNVLRYGVGTAMVASPNPCGWSFRASAPNFMTIAAESERNVVRRRAQGATPGIEVRGVAAYLVSFGSNGRQSLFTPGFLPAQSDEQRNVTRDVQGGFMQMPIFREFNRSISACTDTVATPGTPSCYYDDIVDWIPLTVLQYHLVTAGRLP